MRNNIVEHIDKKEAWKKSREYLNKKETEDNRLELIKKDGEEVIISLDIGRVDSNTDNSEIQVFLMMEYPGGVTAVLCRSMEDYYYHYDQLLSEIYSA